MEQENDVRGEREIGEKKIRTSRAERNGARVLSVFARRCQGEGGGAEKACTSMTYGTCESRSGRNGLIDRGGVLFQ